MDTQPADRPRPARSSGSPLLLAIAWLVVAVPAGWGVSQTVIKSLALFRGPAAPAASAPAVTAPAALPTTQP